MRIKIAALLVAAVAISATLGASAYTTGSVDRTSSVSVASDSNGLIGLSDGTSGSIVHTTNGELTIDFSQVTASGFNPDASFTLGDNTDPTNSSAFSITNNDASSHDFTVEYANSISDDSTKNVAFKIYNSTGTKVATVSEESGSESATLSGVASGETHYVVVDVNTTGLSSGTDLSGTLKVSA